MPSNTCDAPAPFDSGAETVSQSSSSSTLKDDVLTSSQPTEKSSGLGDSVIIQRRTNSKTHSNQQKVELVYQKILRNMIPQPTVPMLNHLCNTRNSAQDLLQLEKSKLQSWQQGLELLHLQQVAEGTQDGRLVHNIRNKSVVELLETLMTDFGRATHSAFLDDSYSIYLSQQERAAICFKVLRKVSLIYGDPLCTSERVGHVFEEFRLFCKRRHWRVAVIAASPNLAADAKVESWSRIEFAVEQVFNPIQNQVLNEAAGKTITRTNRKLFRDGVALSLYDPKQGVRPDLEQDLMDVYAAWREERHIRNTPQAYSAIINPFALPGVTRYMFTRGPNGKPNSLAGLIWLGAQAGYLLEPCIQTTTAPKGTTGFLVTNAMGLLREENVQYMTFGVEAIPRLGEITSMPSLMASVSRRFYGITFDALRLQGRKTFHESFYPEKDQAVPLYLLFPPGLPHLSVYQAVLKAGHIKPGDVWRRWQNERSVKQQERKESSSLLSASHGITSTRALYRYAQNRWGPMAATQSPH